MASGTREECPSVSLVVPLYNEEDNVAPLVEQVHAAMANVDWPWDLILVDDGSSDRTALQLKQSLLRYPDTVRVIILQRNFGQTAAMQAGIDAATGTVIATMDGDLQNHPQDIPRMVRRLLDEDLDLLVGWRWQRKDGLWLRKIPSRLANLLVGRVTGIRLHDYGCSLKIFRTSVLRQIRLYGEMHRFIPTWMATITSPARIGEERVGHSPRVHGKSKYGLSRTFKVILDLLVMYFFMRYRAKPGHFFGRIGLLFGTAGVLILAWLTWVKLYLGEGIADRPLLLLGVLLSLVGVQFLSTGIITEMLARIDYEASGKKPYVVRTMLPDQKMKGQSDGR
ncbi:family 2 glycosyl transferase [Noviherbaspirillum denitrificans]|uniref:Family 2 glycosyl transferase n=1 Tax=Noviherbaspirillum denitrificans TaxID=1968433 RepID=A0A254TLC7_9BURK|nr:family 2 glycosyl transferase [Noviherbaspirillum denitrificans]